jgi:dihydropteroate synthase
MTKRFPWKLPSNTLAASERPLIMGILNVTPDSFSDGGSYSTVEDAIARALEMVAEGADVIDIGGESTRPGSEQVSAKEELARVIPVIAKLAPISKVPISIDTTKAIVAKEAMAAGAQIVNDISGLTFDPDMVEVCASTAAGVIVNHIQGTPQTMQLAPTYHDVVEEVCEFLSRRLAVFEQAGISTDAIMLDPGIGFGKTPTHNIELLKGIRRLHQLQRPVLIGHSRKRFLQKVVGREVDERLFGTIGVSLAVASLGADMIRVHDVRANRDALVAFRAVRDTSHE